MNSPKSLGTVALFETDDGQFAVDVRLENETVWLSPEQMASLFGRDRSVIRKHIRNIFLEGELEEIATWAKFAQVQNEGERAVSRTIDYYNLDVIISVGYRVKSQRGTQFRIWATGMLKEHLIKGYTVNEMRRAGNSAELETALQLVRKAASSTALTTDQGKGLVDVITRYTRTYLLLQQYDEGFLAEPSGTEAAFVLTYSIAKTIRTPEARFGKEGRDYDSVRPRTRRCACSTTRKLRAIDFW